MSVDETRIRPAAPAGRTDWARLWRSYLDFYETALGDDVYDATFARLLSDDPWSPRGFLYVHAGRPIGLVHYLFHAHCWRIGRVCYLQDLYVDADRRGLGAGRALIERVCRAADDEGADGVYWTTQDFNAAARRLYDQVGEVTPFIKYQRPRK